MVQVSFLKPDFLSDACAQMKAKLVFKIGLTFPSFFEPEILARKDGRFFWDTLYVLL